MKRSLSPSHAPMGKVRGVLIDELRAAGEQLRGTVPSDGAVHAIRETLKRSRAALRLLRVCIGSANYRRQNFLVRDAARPLAAVRDSRVLLRAIRSLELDMRPARRRAAAPGAADSFIRRLARELRRQHALRRRELKAATLRAAAASLRKVRLSIKIMADARLARGDLGTALEHAYRAARKAYRRSLRLPSDARLHEWRKQTKYLLHQLDLVAPRGSAPFRKRCRRARRLTRCLGDDHDLALLRIQLQTFRKHAGVPVRAQEGEEVLRRLNRRRRALQKEAHNLGRHLYARKPARVRRRLEQELPPAAGRGPAGRAPAAWRTVTA